MEAQKKYTPGPWVASVPWPGQDTGIYAADGQIYLSRVFHLRGGQDEANARLIAAAPEGFDIIEQLEEAFTADGRYQQFLPAMRAYLSKARGEA